jgi:hypothetical protein
VRALAHVHEERDIFEELAEERFRFFLRRKHAVLQHAALRCNALCCNTRHRVATRFLTSDKLAAFVRALGAGVLRTEARRSQPSDRLRRRVAYRPSARAASQPAEWHSGEGRAWTALASSAPRRFLSFASACAPSLSRTLSCRQAHGPS